MPRVVSLETPEHYVLRSTLSYMPSCQTLPTVFVALWRFGYQDYLIVKYNPSHCKTYSSVSWRPVTYSKNHKYLIHMSHSESILQNRCRYQTLLYLELSIWLNCIAGARGYSVYYNGPFVYNVAQQKLCLKS